MEKSGIIWLVSSGSEKYQSYGYSSQLQNSIRRSQNKRFRLKRNERKKTGRPVERKVTILKTNQL